MKILAIDPGNIKSAYCLIDGETLRPLDFDILGNEDLRHYLRQMPFEEGDWAAIEMIASYGMPVGREVFDTCRWIGRFEETLTRRLLAPPTLVYRMEEKQHICHNSRANDSNIRRALIDRFATHDLKTGRGTKKNPDWFYGFRADIWAAYAVAITCAELQNSE
ncbi:MAG: hypothetical protein LUH03_09775 [Oscillospiraceae bacterium]|nr:hypothetical protein [Oscillospiraceae bacterium]